MLSSLPSIANRPGAILLASFNVSQLLRPLALSLLIVCCLGRLVFKSLLCEVWDVFALCFAED